MGACVNWNVAIKDIVIFGWREHFSASWRG